MDIHEMADLLWISTTTPDVDGVNVVVMSINEVSTYRHHDRTSQVLFLWLRVLAGRGRLERMLADGSDPTDDPRLAMRATQLTRPAERARLAESLRDAVCSLEDTALARYLSSRVPVATESVRTCAREIDELARAMTAPNAGVRGIAIVRCLLTDSRGPLYGSRHAGNLRDTVLAARAAL